MTRYLFALLAFVVACADAPAMQVDSDAHVETVDSGRRVDSGHAPDAGTVDAGEDAGSDAGELDAGTPLEDAGAMPDAAPCECTSGACCDGCHIRPSTWQCVANGPVSATCVAGAGTAPLCPGTSRIKLTYGDRWCDGIRADCRGRIDTSNASPASVSDRCTYDDALYNVVSCRADTSELGASCAAWCVQP